MSPHDTPRAYIYGITTGASTLYDWIIPGDRPGPELQRLLPDMLAQHRDALHTLAVWVEEVQSAGETVRVDEIACVAPDWGAALHAFILEHAVRTGHPLHNAEVQQGRAYGPQEKPPAGYVHVGSMREGPNDTPFYVGFTEESVDKWAHSMAWFAGNPRNKSKGRPHMVTLLRLRQSNSAPFVTVEATVPKAKARETVRTIKHKYGVA